MVDVERLGELPPVPWVRERDIDLLVAELLATEPQFTAWLLKRDIRRPADLPIGEPDQVHAVVNYARPGASSESTGETDVVALATFRSEVGDLMLSIEDKVWATPQRNQGLRHRNFVESCSARRGLAVLLAPRAWLASNSAEAEDYHLTVALEDIAEWCRTQGFGFRAAVFEQACRPPSVELAPELQEWHIAVERLLADQFGLRLAPQRYVRTRNVGQAKSNRWPSCREDTLVRPAGAEQPWIVLKPTSANHPSRVALTLAKAPLALVDAVRLSAAGTGLHVRVTPAGTLLVDKHVPEALPWTQASRFDEQVPYLLAVGAAACELQEWWNGVFGPT